MTFNDPEWVYSETFGKEEWDTLQQVCSDLFPNEELAFEMMYSLIDTENRANSINRRKGILENLEKCVEHCF